MDGGAGTDTLTYSDATGGITINLASGGAQATGGAGSDTISNFNNVTGSDHDDNLTGDANANTINGGEGADTINGGGGADIINGGDGGDTSNGGGGTVTINGGKNDDTINGTNAAETLNGDDGADTINSGGGGDTITGGKGADAINLNATSEADTVKLQGAWGSNWVGDVITTFETANDIIDFTTNYARMDGSTTSSFNTGTTIDDSTAFIRGDGTNVAAGASATVAQVTANLTAGTFDDGDTGGSVDRIYVAWDDGTNSYVGALQSSGGGDGFSGDSLTLIFTLSGLNDCTTLSSGNFQDF